MEGKIKAFITGSFDLYHAGHSLIIKEAGRMCDELFIGLNTDQRIKDNKGPDRPIYPLEHRLQILYHNKNITEVRPIEYDSKNNCSKQGIKDLLVIWKPTIWIIGADFTMREYSEDLKEEFGFEYVRINCELIHTTQIIKRIREGK